MCSAPAAAAALRGFERWEGAEATSSSAKIAAAVVNVSAAVGVGCRSCCLPMGRLALIPLQWTPSVSDSLSSEVAGESRRRSAWGRQAASGLPTTARAARRRRPQQKQTWHDHNSPKQTFLNSIATNLTATIVFVGQHCECLKELS